MSDFTCSLVQSVCISPWSMPILILIFQKNLSILIDFLLRMIFTGIAFAAKAFFIQVE